MAPKSTAPYAAVETTTPTGDGAGSSRRDSEPKINRRMAALPVPELRRLREAAIAHLKHDSAFNRLGHEDREDIAQQAMLELLSHKGVVDRRNERTQA